MIRNFRNVMVLACALALVGMVSPVKAGCKGCDKVAKSGDGFCCGKGKAFGVELTSKKLYGALAGFKVDKDKIKCAGCKKAAETSGRCDNCKMSMANGKAYHSTVSHSLAKGKLVSAEKAASCGGCKTAHKDSGFCTGCNVGFVASRMFKDKETYEAAKTAFATLVKAATAAKKCVGCAIAMVTDSECKACSINFKGGKAQG